MSLGNKILYFSMARIVVADLRDVNVVLIIITKVILVSIHLMV